MSTTEEYGYLIGKFVSAIVGSTTVGRSTSPIKHRYRYREVHGIVQGIKGLNGEAVVIIKTDHNASIKDGELMEIPVSKLPMDDQGKILFAHEPPIDLLSNTVPANPKNFNRRYID